jgi:hypothetical protein
VMWLFVLNLLLWNWSDSVISSLSGIRYVSPNFTQSRADGVGNLALLVCLFPCSTSTGITVYQCKLMPTGSGLRQLTNRYPYTPLSKSHQWPMDVMRNDTPSLSKQSTHTVPNHRRRQAQFLPLAPTHQGQQLVLPEITLVIRKCLLLSLTRCRRL